MMDFFRADKSRRSLPLSAYAGTVVVFNLLLAKAIFGKGKRKRRPMSLQDMILLGVATHKISRTLTKDLVMTPFRTPFTRFQDFLGYGECQEEAREGGVLQSIGELLSCNYCADPWTALGLLYGLGRAPEKTRLLLRFFTSVTIADFLHVMYEMNRTRENVLTLREERMERQEKRAS